MVSVPWLSGGTVAPIHTHTAPRLQLVRGGLRREMRVHLPADRRWVD